MINRINTLRLCGFEGPPLRLLIICVAQALVQIVGFLVSIDSEECQVETSGDEVEILCDKCERKVHVYWAAGVLLAIGLIVVGVGCAAAVVRSTRLCRLYGLVMMIFAFVMALMSLLFGLDSIVLAAAVKKKDLECEDIVQSMIGTSRVTSIIYALNAALAVGGAVWAIKSREQFSYEQIVDGHKRTQSEYTDRL